MSPAPARSQIIADGSNMPLTQDLDLCPAIRELIADRLSVEDISEDTDLLKTGALDSVMLVQLILLLEQQFCVRIDQSKLEIEDLRSVRSISALLTKPGMTKPLDW